MYNTATKYQSNYRSLQRFFMSFNLDYTEYMHFVLKQFPRKEKFYLVMDRTNWKFGRSPINILMLGVIYKKQCFPFCWELLDKGGSSSTAERKDLLQRAISVLGKDRIAGLLGDREFIGVRWFKYLIDEGIEFHIRIPKQIRIGSVLASNRNPVNWLFRHWKENSKTDYPKPVLILGYKLWLSGMRSNKGFCVVVSNKDNHNSLEKYQMRWTIENMFGSLKTRGFNFEQTHMKDLKKIKKLIALVSIAYVWCIMVGVWVSESIKIRIATHGRKEKSIFRVGFDYLTSFIKRLLAKEISNTYEFNEVVHLLSCT
ncbi:MAG: IS4 family transposase [Ignavibacteria bacterium]|nr:IS4 family transposase [Ignavibacteria bacterium]